MVKANIFAYSVIKYTQRLDEFLRINIDEYIFLKGVLKHNFTYVTFI